MGSEALCRGVVLPTLLAAEGFLLCVDELVFLQVTDLVELLPAAGAPVPPLSDPCRPRRGRLGNTRCCCSGLDIRERDTFRKLLLCDGGGVFSGALFLRLFGLNRASGVPPLEEGQHVCHGDEVEDRSTDIRLARDARRRSGGDGRAREDGPRDSSRDVGPSQSRATSPSENGAKGGVGRLSVPEPTERRTLARKKGFPLSTRCPL